MSLRIPSCVSQGSSRIRGAATVARVKGKIRGLQSSERGNRERVRPQAWWLWVIVLRAGVSSFPASFYWARVRDGDKHKRVLRSIIIEGEVLEGAALGEALKPRLKAVSAG
jgi:hypothetical protein